MNDKRESLLITYNSDSQTFVYPASMNEVFAGKFDSRALWDILLEDKIASEKDVYSLKERVEAIASSNIPMAEFDKMQIKDSSGNARWYGIGLMMSAPKTDVVITFVDIEDDERKRQESSECDDFTGLYNKRGFLKAVNTIIKEDVQGCRNGSYAMACFDVLRFKAINDMFGINEGNRLLRYIGDTLNEVFGDKAVLCHPGSDRFVFFAKLNEADLKEHIENMCDKIKAFDLPFEIACNVGVYVTSEEELSAEAMLDRAVLAQSRIKGNYTIRYIFYSEEFRFTMLGEQEIVGMMSTALQEKQFVVYYQPQYNHSTGTLLGAEALVRWKHPERGLISPGVFIPIFEKNGFITNMDFYVFEEVCAFLKKCIDKGMDVVPISTNFSRHDIFQINFVERLNEIREKYEVPVRYLRIELTESSVMGSVSHINEVIGKLHDYGYVVEMDDFGSGYSSLNVLKDIELDVIKLDMLFLSEKSESNRGGTILSSIVRMAKWLALPVIAEGVESVGQADFLKSIGCNYIQGYLYSRPVPEDEYEKILSESKISTIIPQMRLIDNLNACDFWNPRSQETLIFSNYVGGAEIFDYHDGKMEMLRINGKYLKELGMNLSEKEIIERDPLECLDEANKKIFIDTLEMAIDTMEEQECETWVRLHSDCCGEEKLCIRTNLRVIGKSDNSHLFYGTIRNITKEKMRYESFLNMEKRFKMASEQVNIYYWEYSIPTKEMRPCFRCMRDLGLPALVSNYPEPAIEMGIFPQEVADMYRDWHRQLEEGVKELEAVMPLTVGKVPFRVRYTTEFDENGRPIKAYGSAALIED